MYNETMPSQHDEYLYKINANAIANRRYRTTINVFERFYHRGLLDIKQKYNLAQLYDHLAITQGSKHAKQRYLYLQKAENIYREIIKEDPLFFHAWYGLGRVHGFRGDNRTALKFQLRAYKRMLLLPRRKRGALAIGARYEALGNLKSAERWYIREYRDLPKNDFGATLNLFQFYKRNGRMKQALFYARKAEKLLHTEYKKKIYKNLDMKKSEFVRQIKHEIRAIKRAAV